MAKRRQYGTGRLYQPPNCIVWWVQYYVNGRPVRESTGKRKWREADSYLKDRLAEIRAGTYNPKAEQVLISELATDHFTDAELNTAKDIGHARRRWELHLEPRFGNLRAAKLTTSRIRAYQKERADAGAQNGTINREVSLLQRMFSLAHENEKLNDVPYFPRLKEDNVRTGFIEEPQHDLIAKEAAKVGLWIRAMFEVGYTYGWRSEEVTDLRVRQVDLLNRLIRLWSGDTKNDEGRVVKMTKAVYQLLCRCVTDKQPGDFVFTHDDGSPIGDFRKTWWGICVRAGVGHWECGACGEPVNDKKCGACGSDDLKYAGLLFHDLRRTAVRNMVRRGVHDKVAMTISGHKTRSVFDRYNIVSEGQLEAAAAMIEQGAARERKLAKKHKTSINAQGKVHTAKQPAKSKAKAAS